MSNPPPSDDYDPYDLDFTKLLDPKLKVPEPVPSHEQAQALSDEAIIGENELNSNGFFVRINKKAPTRPPHSSPPLVLVVEDDEVTSAILIRALKGREFRVIHAFNRATVSEGFKATPDLVILDVNLPDANGFDILNRIRRHPKLADLPVLMLTSMSGLDDILKGLRLGANGYLTKPTRSKILFDAIKQVLPT